MRRCDSQPGKSRRAPGIGRLVITPLSKLAQLRSPPVCSASRNEAERPSRSSRLEEVIAQADALGKALRFQIKAHHILSGVCEVTEASFETEHEEHACVVSERDAGISAFDTVQGGAAEHGPLGHERSGDTPAPTGIPEIGAQLSEHGEGREGEGRVAVGWHAVRNIDHSPLYCPIYRTLRLAGSCAETGTISLFGVLAAAALRAAVCRFQRVPKGAMRFL